MHHDATGIPVARTRAAGRLRRSLRLPPPPAPAEAVARSAIFVLKMMPLPAGPIDGLTERPIVETLAYPTPAGPVEADFFRPPTPGPHPAVLMSLGVLPKGVVDPRAARLGLAFARAGFAALLHWSPATQELRLDPADLPLVVSAYRTLLDHPSVDRTRSGLMGVCVGGSFALIAAADPAIRDQVAFVAAHSPYSVLPRLAVDVASGTRLRESGREPWAVDPLTWQVWVRSVTHVLPADEAARLCDAYEGRIAWNADKTVVLHAPVRGPVDPAGLSPDGRAIRRVLDAGAEDIEAALEALPESARDLLLTMSPITHVDGIRAPAVVLIHDRDDHVIPVEQSRLLWAAFGGRRGVGYTEMRLRHLRIPRGWTPLQIGRETIRGYLAWYPLFLSAAKHRRPGTDAIA